MILDASPLNVGEGEWRWVNEPMSLRALEYQHQITGRVGEAYYLNGVKFDGVGTEGLVEVKGPGYSQFLDHNGEWQTWFTGTRGMEEQAQHQVEAAGGIPVVWHVAEPDAFIAIRKLVEKFGVKVVHTPAEP